MTKVQVIRNLLKSGMSGTARDFALAAQFDPDSVHPILANMIRTGLVEHTGYDWAPTGQKVKVYSATELIHDDTIPSQPPSSVRYARGDNGQRISAEGLTGLRGIVCAVIADAAKDAINGRGDAKRDAREWFESDAYGFYMDWLGLNPDLKPEFMREAGR